LTTDMSRLGTRLGMNSAIGRFGSCVVRRSQEQS
jgi:hypothetical protein